MPSSFHQWSSPAQREQILPKQPPPIFNRTAPRSGNSARNPFLSPSIEQPRTVGNPLEVASSLFQSSSPTHREIPQKCQIPSINRAAPRGGRYHPPSEMPPFFQQSSSPAQREIPKKQPPPTQLNRAAPRSGIPTPRNAQEMPPPSFHQSSSPASASPPSIISRRSMHITSTDPRGAARRAQMLYPLAPLHGTCTRQRTRVLYSTGILHRSFDVVTTTNRP